ncbi:MAG: hypothetical protein KC933_05565 [Myxococcales bacterium]|nr:hypothetical protein [Myxococcales bacterium]
MAYRWRGLSFAAPEGRDESHLLFVDAAEPPRWNFDLRVEALPKGGLDAYVAAQAAPEGVVRDGRSARTVAGQPALVLSQHLDSGGSTLIQRQAFVAHGERVIIATMTARAGARATAEAALERWMSSLAFEEESP